MIFKEKKMDDMIFEISNCFGNIKLGDFIAIMYLNEALRQDYKKDFRFIASYNLIESIENMANYFPERFLLNGNRLNRYTQLPYSGNIWAYADYIYRFTDVRLYMKNKFKEQFKKNKVVINPLFNSPYHKDRNWSEKTFNNLINFFVNNNYEVVIIGENKHVEKHIDNHSPRNVRRMYNSFENSIREICTSEIYVGGDTGFTHFAAVTAFAPQKIVAIYGDDSNGRHLSSYRESIGLTASQFDTDMPASKINCDFTPKINNDKTMFYSIQKDLNLNKLKEFLEE